MDRRNDGEPASRQTAQKPNDPPRTLRIQSRRRFVAEEDRRSTDDLHRDRQALALLEAEPGGRVTDDGVLEVRKIEEVEDNFDVGELFGVRDLGILTKDGGELERFADGRAVVCVGGYCSARGRSFSAGRLTMQIKLLDVTGRAIKLGIRRLTIDEHCAFDDSIAPASKRVEHCASQVSAREQPQQTKLRTG